MNTEHVSVRSTRPQSSTRAVPSGQNRKGQNRKRRILVALHDLASADVTLQRAFALARLDDSDVHVLGVVPTVHQVNPLFPQQHALHVQCALDDVVAVTAELRRKVTNLFPQWASERRVEVRTGTFVREVRDRVDELSAYLVVMQPSVDCRGSDVALLANTTGVAILVARSATSNESIVAATDLRDGAYPVLSRAAALGVRLEAPVVAIHNIIHAHATMTDPLGWPLSPLSSERLRETRRRDLEESARQTRASSSDLAHDIKTSRAILRQARALDADLVVVGTRRRSWLARFFSTPVAEEVVDHARRSVLVVPISEHTA